LWLFFYAAGFIVLITLAAKKADRYALPALAMLSVIAGWMFGVGIHAWRKWVLSRRAPHNPHSSSASPSPASWRGLGPLGIPFGLAASRRATHFALGLVIIFLIAHTLLLSPYAIAYNSPLFPNIRPASQQGWGEGLDAAARWLNEHSLAEKLMVASWYPGVTGTYFDGKTTSLSARDDDRVGFVVLYRNMFGRGEDEAATSILAEFRDKNPVKVVSIQGEPYAFIFNTIGLHYFSEHTGELTGGMEVGQTIPVERDGFSSIEIALATFSSRANTHDVIVEIRESPDATEALRTATVNASRIEDRSWQRFDFEPLPDSGGKTYYAALTSPRSVPGDAIAAWFVQEDILPGQLLLRRRHLGPREANSDFLRQGDLAYRLP
jgi:hypothetical protein